MAASRQHRDTAAKYYFADREYDGRRYDDLIYRLVVMSRFSYLTDSHYRAIMSWFHYSTRMMPD